MRRSWTPSIVPSDVDQTVYLVLDDYGRAGRVWREANAEDTDLESIIRDLMGGEFNDPVRVVAFNTSEHTADDVSADIAREIRHRADRAGEDVTSSIDEFVTRYAGPERQLTLRLA